MKRSLVDTSFLSTIIPRFTARRLLLGSMVIFSTALAGPLQLEPADSPVDNPMKGLVPYAGNSPTCWVI